jgi:hypothetical protein
MTARFHLAGRLQAVMKGETARLVVNVLVF